MPNVYGTDFSETINAFDGVTNSGEQIFGYGGHDDIFGLGGADSIFGGDGNDEIFGGSGNDMLKGGGGADDLDGGTGTDQANYTDSTEGVVVSLLTGQGFGGTAEGDHLTSIEDLSGSDHADWLIGNNSANELNGWADADVLKGAGGADTLNGDSGNDLLEGGTGGDNLNGGTGTDTAIYDESAAGVVVSLITNTGSGGDATGDELDSIENLTGSAHGDTLIGNDSGNVLRGLGGNDSLKGFGGNDELHGGSGNDYMNGGTGVDDMIGGLGNDSYVVDHGSDEVIEAGGEGGDVVSTSVNWTMTAGSDIETLKTTDDEGTTDLYLAGNSTNNTIIGNDGDNTLNGYGGTDDMIGNDGNDTYYVNHAGDAVTEVGGEGNDEVYTSASWAITAGADVEMLSTTNDFGLGAIHLTGNETNNEIKGNNGNNTINGGLGGDELTGLGGQDSFRFDTTLGGGNVDTITDFTVAVDKIVLENSVFGALGAGALSAEAFVIDEMTESNDHILYDSASGALYYDSDGTGAAAAVQFATLDPGLALTHNDFLVV